MPLRGLAPLSQQHWPEELSPHPAAVVSPLGLWLCCSLWRAGRPLGTSWWQSLKGQ